MYRPISATSPYLECGECHQDTRHVCDTCEKGLCMALDCQRRHGYACAPLVVAEDAVPSELPVDKTPKAHHKNASLVE